MLYVKGDNCMVFLVDVVLRLTARRGFAQVKLCAFHHYSNPITNIQFVLAKDTHSCDLVLNVNDIHHEVQCMNPSCL